MKREIKFRAWHKDDKCFIGLWGSGMYMYENGEIYAGNMNVTSRIELLQFTGLKDKCGKDIYEGDVLRYYSDARMAMPTKDGGWELRGNSHLEERTIAEYSNEYGSYMVHGGSMNLFEINDKSEVIGNIYENPELMEEWK